MYKQYILFMFIKFYFNFLSQQPVLQQDLAPTSQDPPRDPGHHDVFAYGMV